jgi:hypothetical protein
MHLHSNNQHIHCTGITSSRDVTVTATKSFFYIASVLVFPRIWLGVEYLLGGRQQTTHGSV